MKKRTMYSEAAYLVGLAVLAIATAMMERADFGMSMVVAPAYLAHLKISAIPGWAFMTFGTAEYLLQLLLLVGLTAVMRRFRLSYLFSFVTAVVYGLMLDGSIALIGLIPGEGMLFRAAFYVLGMVLCSSGVSLLFHTYIAPEAYELVVKEIAAKWKLDIHRTKTVYDLVSCAVAVVMSFVFFGFGVFKGVKWGTIVCALVNGWLIGLCSRFFEKNLSFRDGLKLRRFFE